MTANIRLTSLTGVLALFVVGYVYTLGANKAPSTVTTGTRDVQEEKSWFDGLFDEAEKRAVPGTTPVLDVLKLQDSLSDLHVPCGYIISISQYTMEPRTLQQAPVNPLDTSLEPSRKFSTITRSSVMADRYLRILYEEGGKSKVIPAGALYLRMGSLEATVPSPELQVVEDGPPNSISYPYNIRLGRDFMKQNEAKVDLEEGEMHISVEGARVMIPFLKRRSSTMTGDEL